MANKYLRRLKRPVYLGLGVLLYPTASPGMNRVRHVADVSPISQGISSGQSIFINLDVGRYY